MAAVNVHMYYVHRTVIIFVFFCCFRSSVSISIVLKYLLMSILSGYKVQRDVFQINNFVNLETLMDCVLCGKGLKKFSLTRFMQVAACFINN